MAGYNEPIRDHKWLALSSLNTANILVRAAFYCGKTIDGSLVSQPDLQRGSYAIACLSSPACDARIFLLSPSALRLS